MLHTNVGPELDDQVVQTAASGMKGVGTFVGIDEISLAFCSGLLRLPLQSGSANKAFTRRPGMRECH